MIVAHQEVGIPPGNYYMSTPATVGTSAVTETVITIKQNVRTLLMVREHKKLKHKEHKIQKKLGKTEWKEEEGVKSFWKGKQGRREAGKTNCFREIYSWKFILHLNFVWMVIKWLRNETYISFSLRPSNLCKAPVAPICCTYPI